MNRPFVSISIPIYNAEKDLPRCIESIINQTLKNIEIILINDGSCDKSGEICEYYALKDNRIKVIHKANGGSASARQYGLNASTGIYYTVCDSDDWVEPNMYEELYNKAISNDLDIVLSGHYIDYPNGKRSICKVHQFTNQDQYIFELMMGNSSVATWSKLFKLDTLRTLKISYEEGINLGEDALFLYKILKNSVNISHIDREFYHYQRDIKSNSYTNNISHKTFTQNEYIHNWKVINYNDTKYTPCHIYSAINLTFTALRAHDIDNATYNKIAKKISIHDLYKHKIITSKSLLIISTKIFGYKFGKYLLEILYKYFYK